jgi:hypothetical protein
MSLAALMNLGFAGGEQPLVTDANQLIVRYEDRELVVTRGEYSIKTIYLDKGTIGGTQNVKRISTNWEKWLPSGVTISTSAWEVQDSNTLITITSEAKTSTATECYLSTSQYGMPLFVKNTIVTNAAIPETDSRSFLIKRTRTF